MRKAAEILARLLERGAKSSEPYSSLFGAWQEIAGVSLADHSRVYEIRHRNLFVEVDHPGWLQLLLLHKPSILAKVRRLYPQLQILDMKVRVNLSAPAPEPVREEKAAPPEQAPIGTGGEGETAIEVRQAIESVADAGLREKLRRLLLSIAARRSDTNTHG